jgi:hypothetical protein
MMRTSDETSTVAPITLLDVVDSIEEVLSEFVVIPGIGGIAIGPIEEVRAGPA